MRILYVYPTERNSIRYGVEKGQLPDTLLYGLNHMSEFGIQADFFDEDRKMRFPYRLIQAFGRLAVRYTTQGWNIGIALQSLPRLRNYDFVIATSDSAGLPLAFLKRLGLWQGKLVMISQGLTHSLSLKGENWVFRLHRWSMSAIDHIISFGWAEREELINFFGIQKDRAHWIPVGVDADFFFRCFSSQTNPNENVVLSVGRDRCRDFNILLDIAKSLPDISFRIITTKGRLKLFDLPANVDVLFDLPIQEVVSHYAACRFVVLPTHDSPYSFGTITALDAMAMGKAVLLSDTSALGPDGSAYDLINGEHCRLLPVGDSFALSAAIRKLWDNQQLCVELGCNAQSKVNSSFTTKLLAYRLKNIFQS